MFWFLLFCAGIGITGDAIKYNGLESPMTAQFHPLRQSPHESWDIYSLQRRYQRGARSLGRYFTEMTFRLHTKTCSKDKELSEKYRSLCHNCKCYDKRAYMCKTEADKICSSRTCKPGRIFRAEKGCLVCKCIFKTKMICLHMKFCRKKPTKFRKKLDRNLMYDYLEYIDFDETKIKEDSTEVTISESESNEKTTTRKPKKIRTTTPEDEDTETETNEETTTKGSWLRPTTEKKRTTTAKYEETTTTRKPKKIRTTTPEDEDSETENYEETTTTRKPKKIRTTTPEDEASKSKSIEETTTTRRPTTKKIRTTTPEDEEALETKSAEDTTTTRKPTTKKIRTTTPADEETTATTRTTTKKIRTTTPEDEGVTDDTDEPITENPKKSTEDSTQKVITTTTKEEDAKETDEGGNIFDKDRSPDRYRIPCSKDLQVIHNSYPHMGKCQFCACYNNEWLCRVSEEDCPEISHKTHWCENEDTKNTTLFFHHHCYQCRCHKDSLTIGCVPYIKGDNWDEGNICATSSPLDPQKILRHRKLKHAMSLYH